MAKTCNLRPSGTNSRAALGKFDQSYKSPASSGGKSASTLSKFDKPYKSPAK